MKFQMQSLCRAAMLIWLASSFVPDANAQGSPLCVYNSAEYSDGAFICVQRSLMLTCQADGAKATWKPVTDKDINERCTAPLVSGLRGGEQRRVRRHFVRSQMSVPVAPAQGDQSKCFNFNGKRYCE